MSCLPQAGSTKMIFAENIITDGLQDLGWFVNVNNDMN